MWNELGISGGTAIVILIALYFVIKWAVKNGIKEAYSAITSNRCYRRAHNFDYCYEEIEKNLGKMYDPIVGIDVLDNWDEI